MEKTNKVVYIQTGKKSVSRAVYIDDGGHYCFKFLGELCHIFSDHERGYYSPELSNPISVYHK